VSPTFRAFDPAGAFAASAIRSAVRRVVSSPSSLLVPQVLRSAGISVLFSHDPFA